MSLDNNLKSIRNVYNQIEYRTNRIASNTMGYFLLWTLVVAMCFAIILLLNIFTPITSDDFGYLYIHAENTRIASLSDIIHSQINHYNLWGGRSIVHAIAEALLLLPPLVIDILNSIVYLVYIFLIYLFIKGRKRNSLTLYTFVNLGVWFIQPAFGDTILWITGSANYLWGTSIILLFLLPYRLYEGKKHKNLTSLILTSIAFFVFGIVAGWTNENTAGAMLCIVIMFTIYYKSNKWNIPIWDIAGFAGALGGYIIMIAAPGNAVRAGEAGELSVFIICYRFLMHSYTLFTNYGVLLIAFSVATLLLHRFGKTEKEKVLKLSFIFFIGFIISIYVMILSPSFPDRAWFGSITYMIIAVGILLYNLNFDYKFLRQICFSILFVGLIAFAFSLYGAAKEVHHFYTIYQQRQMQVDDAKKEGLNVCQFERYEAKTKFVHSEEPLSYHLMGRYYGIPITFGEDKPKDK